jgi:hypothetical protein
MVFEEFKPAAAGIGLVVLAIVLLSISTSLWQDTSWWLKGVMVVLAPLVAYIVVDFKSD